MKAGKRWPGSGSIYYRPAGDRWVVSWAKADGKRGSKSFKSEQEARTWWAKQRPDVQGLTWSHGSDVAYKVYGCRCDTCQDGRRERERLRAEQVRAKGDFKHGTAKGYTYAQCRCDACTEFMRLRQRKRSGRNLPDGDLRHGTPRGFDWGCRCRACRDARNEKKRVVYERAKQAGTWNHGTYLAYEAGCRCDTCLPYARRKYFRETSVNAQSRQAAHHHRQIWTGPELELVYTRPDLTARELAVMLGRTIRAVRCARAAIATDPRKASLAGAVERWSQS